MAIPRFDDEELFEEAENTPLPEKLPTLEQLKDDLIVWALTDRDAYRRTAAAIRSIEAIRKGAPAEAPKGTPTTINGKTFYIP